MTMRQREREQESERTRRFRWTVQHSTGHLFEYTVLLLVLAIGCRLLLGSSSQVVGLSLTQEGCWFTHSNLRPEWDQLGTLLTPGSSVQLTSEHFVGISLLSRFSTGLRTGCFDTLLSTHNKIRLYKTPLNNTSLLIDCVIRTVFYEIKDIRIYETINYFYQDGVE